MCVFRYTSKGSADLVFVDREAGTVRRRCWTVSPGGAPNGMEPPPDAPPVGGL